MKVAIITITDGANYGNRLQNYALQTVLQKIGLECETIKRSTSRDSSIIRKVGSRGKDILRMVLGKKTNRIYRIRRKRFEAFNKKHILWSNYTLKKNTAPKGLQDHYQYFICGSDQIWNVKFDVVKEDILNYLAFFARPEQRVSYAASFGTSNIQDERYLKLFTDELPKFKAISVREKTGIDLVNRLAGKPASLVLDPTMLLAADDWKNGAKKPDYVDSNDSFVVTYFMSGRNAELDAYIDGVKSNFGCSKVINLDMEFIERCRIEDDTVFCTTPDEFLWLISHSSAVLTDSFHATVFALLFHKPFCVFERKAKEAGNNMGSRIETLLSYFELNRFQDDITSPHIIPEKYDYEKVEIVPKLNGLDSLVTLILTICFTSSI